MLPQTPQIDEPSAPPLPPIPGVGSEEAANDSLANAILRSSADAIFAMTLSGVVTSWNPAAVRLFGCSAEEMIGQQTTLPFFPDRLAEKAYLLRCLERGDPVSPFESAQMLSDGTQSQISFTLFSLRTVAGEAVGTGVIARRSAEPRQVAELEQANRQLEAMNTRLETLATTDGLTGAKNHWTFQERLKAEIYRAVRYRSNLSILMLDVDRFKPYNDAFGHPAGDAVLRAVAGILHSATRTTDLVARYGGDEFAVILPEADSEQARAAAERFRAGIAEAEWSEWPVTASFGAATLSVSTASASALIAEADAALYRSKGQGCNCVTHAQD